MADLRLGIAHADEELCKRLHHQMDGVDAAVHADDPWRRAGGEDRAHVRVGDPVRIERENPLRDRRVHRRRPQGGVLLELALRERGWATGRRGRAAGHREQEEDAESGAQAAQASASFRLSIERRKAAVTSSTVAREKAAVRYDTPTCMVSCAVVTAKTSGQSGPVGTARK